MQAIFTESVIPKFAQAKTPTLHLPNKVLKLGIIRIRRFLK